MTIVVFWTSTCSLIATDVSEDLLPQSLWTVVIYVRIKVRGIKFQLTVI